METRMKRKEKRQLGAFSYLYAGLIYLFLYLPIFMVVGYSFNTNDTTLCSKASHCTGMAPCSRTDHS